jgi:hypothetical protein
VELLGQAIGPQIRRLDQMVVYGDQLHMVLKRHCYSYSNKGTIRVARQSLPAVYADYLTLRTLVIAITSVKIPRDICA